MSGRKLLAATRDVLRGLNRAESVVSALGLNGHDKLLAVSVDADIDFINFNLSHFRRL